MRLTPDTLEALGIPPDVDGRVWRMSPGERRANRLMHRHRELEVNLAVGGRAAYLLRDRRTGEVRRYPLNRGALLFLYPEQDHLLVDPDEAFELWIAVFTPTMVNRVAVDLPQGDRLVDDFPPPRVGTRLDEREARRIEALMADVEAEPEVSGVRGAGLAYLLARSWSLVLRADAEPIGTAVHSAVARAARLLHDEVEPLSVAALARRAGLSPSRLSRLFHAQTGETIVAFRNRRRLERFQETASEIDATLSSRALAAGFGSYAQFDRVYRAATGAAPSSGKRGAPAEP